VSADATQSPTIVVNGDERPLERGATIGSLLEEFGLDPRAVAVELNGSVLRRDRLAATELADGDRLEIVRFVQGGARGDRSSLDG